MCKSSSSVFKRTSPSLLHTFVVDTLLNFPMPFNIILSYANRSRVNDIRRPLVRSSSSLLLVHGKGFILQVFWDNLNYRYGFFVILLFCQDGMFKLKDSYQCSVLVAKALDFESKSSYLLNITASNVSFASVLQYLQSMVCTLLFYSDLVKVNE